MCYLSKYSLPSLQHLSSNIVHFSFISLKGLLKSCFFLSFSPFFLKLRIVRIIQEMLGIDVLTWV